MTKDIKQLKKSLEKLQKLIKENSKSKSYVEDLFEMRRSEEIDKTIKTGMKND